MNKENKDILLGKYIDLLPDNIRPKGNYQDVFWNQFYDILEELWSKQEIQKINELMSSLDEITSLNIKIQNKDILNKMIALFYNIIITRPFPSSGILSGILSLFKKIISAAKPDDLNLDWKPMYKAFILLKKKEDPENMSVQNSMILGNALSLASKLSKYYPPDTLEILLHRYFSADINKSDVFVAFMPKIKDSQIVRKWLPRVLSSLKKVNSLVTLDDTLKLMSKLMARNLEEDYSELLPIFLYQLTQNLSTFKSKCQCTTSETTMSLSVNKYMGIVTAYLIISPSTRKDTLKGLTRLVDVVLTRKKAEEDNNIDITFLYMLRKLYCYKLRMQTEQVKLSEDDFYSIVTPIISEVMVLVTEIGVNKGTIANQIQVAASICDKIVPQLFEFAFQCIKCTETETNHIAFIGWATIKSIMHVIHKLPELQKKLGEIIDIGLNSMYLDELIDPIITNINLIFTTFPIGRENAFPAMKDLNYPRIASEFVKQIFAFIKRSNNYHQFYTSSCCTVIYSVFSTGDDEMRKEMVDTVIEILGDTDFKDNFLSIGLSINTIFIDERYHPQFIRICKGRMENARTKEDLSFYIESYGFVVGMCSQTIDDVKKYVKEIQNYADDENEKVQRVVWNAISDILSPFESFKVRNKTGKAPQLLDKIENFEVEYKPEIDTEELLYEIVKPVYDKMMKIEDPVEMLKLLKSIKYGFKNAVFYSHKNIKGEKRLCSNISMMRDRGEFVDSYPRIEECYKAVNRVLRDFGDNPAIVSRAVNIPWVDFVLDFEFPLSSVYETTYYINMTAFWEEVYYGNNVNISMIMCILQRFLNFKFEYSRDKHPLNLEFLRRVIELSMRSEAMANATRKILSPLGLNMPDFIHCYPELVEEAIRNAPSIPDDLFLRFLENTSIIIELVFNPQMLCDVYYHILTHFNLEVEESINSVYNLVINVYYNMSIHSRSIREPFEKLIEKMDSIVENFDALNSTVRSIIIIIYLRIIKSKIPLSEKGYEFTKRMCSSESKEQSVLAQNCIFYLFYITKEVREISVDIEKKTLDHFPDLISKQKAEFVEEFTFDLPTNEEEDSEDNDKKVFGEIIKALQTGQVTPEVMEIIQNTPRDVLMNLLMQAQQSKPRSKHQNTEKIFEEMERAKMTFDLDLVPYYYQFRYMGRHIFPGNKVLHLFKERPRNFVSMDEIVSILGSLINGTIPDNFTPLFSCLTTTGYFFNESDINTLAESIKGIFNDSFTAVSVSYVTQVINGLTDAYGMHIAPDSVVDLFLRKILFPSFTAILQKPQYYDTFFNELMLHYSTHNISLISVYLRFCIDTISDGSPNINLLTSGMLYFLLIIISSHPQIFFPSIDFILDRLLLPYFSKLPEYPARAMLMMFTIFILLIESTDLPEDSEMLSDAVIEKQKYLIQILDEFLSGVDPMMREYQKAISALLKSISQSASLILVARVVIKHLPKICQALDNTDPQTESFIIIALSDTFIQPVYEMDPLIVVDFVGAVVANIKSFGAQLQKNLARIISEVIYVVCPVLTDESVDALFVQFDTLARETSPAVTKELLKGLGLLIMMKDGDFEMDEYRALAVISVARLFDRVEKRVLEGFVFLSENSDKRSKGIGELTDTIVKHFWHHHSDNVMPAVEEALCEYRSLIAPSYIL